MAQGTPIFPDLGYAISHTNVVSVGFSPNQYHPHQHQMAPQYQMPYQQPHPQYPSYAISNQSNSPNSSPQSQVSTIYPPSTQYHFYQPETPLQQQQTYHPPPAQIPEPARPEFKRRKTFPVQPPKPQGNRRIPRVIAAAAPKAKVQKQQEVLGGALYNVNDPRMVKEFYGELERQKSAGEKEATVFGYVFDGSA